MYEAMQQRHRPPIPPVHTECTNVLTALTTKLTHILECGSTADCATAIEELTALTSGYDYLKAMLAHQLEKEVFRTNENNGTHPNDLTRGAASTVAMARKRDPHGYRSYLANARILAEDTPFTAQRFALGELTEPQVMAILTPLQDVNAARRTAFDTHFR
ncbi:HNH endonuclease, partial [Glutamicibacter protophormiae]